MKALIQRVTSASVSVKGQQVGEIDRGLLVLLGIEKQDTEQTIEKMANKLLAYRVFSDADGKMNLSVKDINAGLLVVSQFTLAADTSKGLRPGFSNAAAPEIANEYYLKLVQKLRLECQQVETGEFAADMQVSLVNDGPVTFLLEC